MRIVKQVDHIKLVLTDKGLSAFKSLLGKKHAIDLVFLLYLDKGCHKDAKLFMRNLGIPFSDGAYYARMQDLLRLGLAKRIPVDSKRNYYAKTDLGENVAKFLLKFFEKLAE